MGQSVALKLQGLPDALYLEHILDQSFYRHIKNRCMQKLKADQARKRKNMAFCLRQNTRNLQHTYRYGLRFTQRSRTAAPFLQGA